ncbi:hypothetical protein AO411_2022790 [Salmonella enterica subsp. enterica serovar Sarajane]|nr:hypothetical protein AO411_2022790 [Salmonella enterica subsp. enterica serovar Sarajane]
MSSVSELQLSEAQAREEMVRLGASFFQRWYATGSVENLSLLLGYQNNSECKAVVHLHCNYLTALSCLDDLDSKNSIKPLPLM